MFVLTDHAERRAQQRTVTRAQLQLATEYGHPVPGGYLLTAKDRDRAIADAAASKIQGDYTPEQAHSRIKLARRTPDLFVGVKEGAITTVFRPNRLQRKLGSASPKHRAMRNRR